MYVFMSVLVYVCMCVRWYARECTCARAFVCTWCKCIFVCVCVCVVYVHVYVCVCKCMCVCMRVCVHACVCVYAYISYRVLPLYKRVCFHLVAETVVVIVSI